MIARLGTLKNKIAWDISKAAYETKTLSVSSQIGASSLAAGLYINPDGLTAYIMDSVTAIIYQYTLSTAWDMSTGSYG